MIIIAPCILALLLGRVIKYAAEIIPIIIPSKGKSSVPNMVPT